MKCQDAGPKSLDIEASWNRFLHCDSREKWQSSIGDIKRGRQQVSLQKHNHQVNGKSGLMDEWLRPLGLLSKSANRGDLYSCKVGSRLSF